MNDQTRRGVLSGLGTVALASVAGCNVLNRGQDDSPPRLEPDAVETILDMSAPDVRRPAPVQPSSEAIEAGLTRSSELLAAVPESISSDEIPNGVVRQGVESAHKDALDAREEVEVAPDRLRALEAVRTAREHAREAAVGFESVREDLAADVEAERNETRTAIGTRLAQVEYAGEDRERTLLVAFRSEEFLTNARRRITHGPRTADPSALDVADVAGDVEYASATIDLVEELTDRHADAATDPVDFTTSAAGALQASMAAIGRAGVPDSDTSVEDVFGEEPDRRDLQYLAANAISAVGQWREALSTELDEARFASGLERAIRLERDAKALDTVIDRIDGGDVPEPESAEPVRDEREAALAAVDDVPISPSEPSLAGDVLAQLLQRLTFVDAELDRYLDRDTDVALSREYASYVHLRARIEALPDTIEAVRGRLDTQLP